MQTLHETDFWNPTFFHHALQGLFTATSCCKMWICILGFIYGSCMIRWSATLSSCSSGVLKQSVSRTMGRTRWTNSKACCLPWFKSLRFLSLGTSEACCLCYRSQWRPGLATTNTEWLNVPWTVRHDINFEAITNLMHKYLYSYNITVPYMFRALLCSSSGGSIIYIICSRNLRTFFLFWRLKNRGA